MLDYEQRIAIEDIRKRIAKRTKKTEQQRRAYIRNPERFRAKARRYQKAHRAELREYDRAHWYDRPEVHRIRKATATMMVAHLRERKRHFRADKIVGCAPEFFRDYIEGKFEPGMSWDNHGEWHIDHIRPLSSFDFKAHPEDTYRAGHYTNLQPMWAKAHLIKGARYEVEAIA